MVNAHVQARRAGGCGRGKAMISLAQASCGAGSTSRVTGGMLLAGIWLRGTGFERAIERAPEDRATSHGSGDGRDLRNFVHRYLPIYQGGGTQPKRCKSVEYIYSYLV